MFSLQQSLVLTTLLNISIINPYIFIPNAINTEYSQSK